MDYGRGSARAASWLLRSGWLAALGMGIIAYSLAFELHYTELQTARYAEAIAVCANRGDFLIGNTIVHCDVSYVEALF